MSEPPHAQLMQSLHDALSREAYAAAIELLDAALASAPDDAALLHCRGATHALSTAQWPPWSSGGEARRDAALRAALTDLGRAIERCPSYAEAWLNRGITRLLLADRAGGDADLSRALDLGLELVFALQAYSSRGGPGDLDVVNKLRKKRGLGDEWRESVPQRATLRAQVPAAAAPAPKPRARRAKRVTPRATEGAPDGSADATVTAFEALTARALATAEPAALKKLGRELEALSLLEATDEPELAERVSSCIERLRAHAATLPTRAARELEALLDVATSS